MSVTDIHDLQNDRMDVVLRVAIGLVVFWLIWKAGRAMLGGLVRPMPEPPPPGELRKVKLLYRCPVCGTEVRMTVANDEVPDPPRHCMDEMELVAPPLE